MKITVKSNDRPIYDIDLEHNYDSLIDVIDNQIGINKKVCIVTDSNVSNYYLNKLTDLIKDHVKEVSSFTFSAGEDSKTLDTVYDLYETLISKEFDRKDFLIALGGGVVGDLTGYAAATYLRGISFIQVPTTLLSMVDSSIGGKTGVDFRAYKNMIGAFHQPKAVYINLSTLKSLDKEQFYSGLGEVIKHGLIKDKTYYHWLKENRTSIINMDLSIMEELIAVSCNIKREVVERDPKEQGERALLNFGHTIGHAVEKLKEFKLYHGQCVAIGMVAASYISYKKGYLTLEELDDIKETITSLGLPVSVSGLDAKDILKTTRNDKKMEMGTLKFILLSEIGNGVIDTSLTEEDINQSIEYILN